MTWQRARLDELVSLRRGHDLTWRDRKSGSVPVMGSAGANGVHDRAIAPGPGVVIGRSGASYGQAHYVEQDYWPHNTALYVTDFRGNNVDYVFHLLDYIDFSQYNSGGAQQSLNRNFIAGILVSFPDPAEQERIAAALNDGDLLIESLQRLNAKKRDVRQRMMQELLTGHTRLPGFSDVWREVMLGEHVSYLRAVALSRDQLDRESPLRYLHYGDIHTRSSIFLDAMTEVMPRADAKLAGKASRLMPGDLVFADASEDPAGVGKSVELTNVPANGVVPGLHTIAARFDKQVLADGFKAYLQSMPEFRSALLRLAAGTKVLATTRAYISSITLTLPPVDEQRAIARTLRDADAEIEALEQRLESARAVKAGMMQELVTGRTRLPVKEDA